MSTLTSAKCTCGRNWSHVDELLQHADNDCRGLPYPHIAIPDLTKASVASQQYEWITEQPYTLTSDDVIFRRVAEKEAIPQTERAAAQEEYFQKGRACLRTSPLARQYGWGIHANNDGKIALVAAESDEYAALVADDTVKKVAAMKRSR